MPTNTDIVLDIKLYTHTNIYIDLDIVLDINLKLRTI